MKSAISSIFKTFFLSLLVVAQVHFAYAQTASILPPAKTTFVDQNGKPLTSGTVESFIPLTSTHKTTWQDAAETIPNTNPVVLDAAGRALILGSGSYRQVVKDRNNNLIWDQVTSSTGSGGGGGSTATGDGDLVGTIKPWAGMVAPNQYMFTAGQEVSRVTFSALYTAMTSSQSIFCNSGSAILNGLSDTTNFWVGMPVEVSCVAAGFSTIVSKTLTTVTLAANANVTTNVTAIFYPWGRGNGTTTFNLPDLRGQVLAGNNNMNGVASANLTTTFFGIATPNATGAAGGSQSTSIVLLPANLPPYTPAGTITNGAITINPGSVIDTAGGALVPGGGSLGNVHSTSASQAASTFAGTAAPGQVSAPIIISKIQPTITTNYIIKVTPDANSATASGVTALGAMTGSISCGTGLLCTGNNISATAPIITIGSTVIAGSTDTYNLYSSAGVLANTPGRLGVTSPITLYVNPSNTTSALCNGGSGGIGNDSNAGTLAAPFLTPNKALNVAQTNYDVRLGQITIQYCDNDVTTAVYPVMQMTANLVGAISGGGVSNSQLIIKGNSSSPAKTIVQGVATAPAFTFVGITSPVMVKDMQIGATLIGGATTGHGISVDANSMVYYANINWGFINTAYSHMNVTYGSFLEQEGVETIFGGAGLHWNTDNLSQVLTTGNLITCTGTPAFTSAFVAIQNISSFRLNSATFSAGCTSVTGPKYIADFLSTTGGTDLNTVANFPGSSNGTVAYQFQSTSTSALCVGRTAACSNPSFNIDASTASSVTGVNIKSAAAGARVAISVISSGTNEGLDIDAKGSGTIRLGNVSTGTVQIGAGVIGLDPIAGAITASSDLTITRATGTLSESLIATAGQVQVAYTGGSGGISYFMKDNAAGADLKFFQLISAAGLTSLKSLTDIGGVKSTFQTMDHNTGQINFPTATASTSSTTGAVKFGGGVGIAGALYGGAEVVTGTTVVGSLPTCNAAHKAARHFVTDANATFTAGIGAVVAAGGANNVPVTCDGTNWRIG